MATRSTIVNGTTALMICMVPYPGMKLCPM